MLKLTTLTPGEFFDRFTITILKARYSDDYRQRVESLVDTLNQNELQGDLLYEVCSLMMVNTDIWNLEADIRQGEEGTLGLKEVGERALKIRNENKRRVGMVNTLNELFGDYTKETKHDHAAQ